MEGADVGYLRIGELARRTGLNAEVVRAWERRYGLLRPTRSSGGFRLYSDDDVACLETMKRHLAAGIAAAQAARLTLAEPRTSVSLDTSSLAERRTELREALEQYDETRAHQALDRALATFTLAHVLRDLVLPYLRELGAGWECGEISVAQEHFASHFLRGRLLGLARSWGRGAGGLAVLACPRGEQHDLGLICFGLVLREAGWRIVFLGADTPVEVLLELSEQLSPSLVVLSAVSRGTLAAAEESLRQLAARTPLGLAGEGASAKLADRIGARLLGGDPVTAAQALLMPVAA
jgi:MerR family transcriptional regulator, light-induced transcriptional regulator